MKLKNRLYDINMVTDFEILTKDLMNARHQPTVFLYVGAVLKINTRGGVN